MKPKTPEPTQAQTTRKRALMHPARSARPTRGQLVRRLRSRMPELVERYGVKSLGIFGSYLRGAEKPRSDFDVLVEIDSPKNSPNYEKLWEIATVTIPIEHPLVAAVLEQELARRAEHDAKKENGK